MERTIVHLRVSEHLFAALACGYMWVDEDYCQFAIGQSPLETSSNNVS